MFALTLLGNYVPVLTEYGYVYAFFLKPGIKLILIDSETLNPFTSEIIDIKFDVEEVDRCFVFPFLLWFEPFKNYLILNRLNFDLFSISPCPDASLFKTKKAKRAGNLYQRNHEPCNETFYSLKNAEFPAFVFRLSDQQKLAHFLKHNVYCTNDLISALDAVLILNSTEDLSSRNMFSIRSYARKFVVGKTYRPKKRFISKDGNAHFVKKKLKAREMKIGSANALKSIIILETNNIKSLPVVANILFKPIV